MLNYPYTKVYFNISGRCAEEGDWLVNYPTLFHQTQHPTINVHRPNRPFYLGERVIDVMWGKGEGPLTSIGMTAGHCGWNLITIHTGTERAIRHHYSIARMEHACSLIGNAYSMKTKPRLSGQVEIGSTIPSNGDTTVPVMFQLSH